MGDHLSQLLHCLTPKTMLEMKCEDGVCIQSLYLTKRLDGNTCNFNELTLHGGYHDNQDGGFTISGYRLLTSTARTVREACPVSFQQATGSSLHQRRKLGPLLPAPLAKFSSVQFSCSVVSNSFDSMDCSTPGFLVHHQLPELAHAHVHWVGDAIHPRNSPGIQPGILQARILEWVAVPFSRGSSPPRNRTQVSHIAGGFFTSWDTREAQVTGVGSLSLLQQIIQTQELNRGLLYCWWILYQVSYQGSPL